jgi:hypothetical protein
MWIFFLRLSPTYSPSVVLVSFAIDVLLLVVIVIEMLGCLSCVTCSFAQELCHAACFVVQAVSAGSAQVCVAIINLH